MIKAKGEEASSFNLIRKAREDRDRTKEPWRVALLALLFLVLIVNHRLNRNIVTMAPRNCGGGI